MICKYTIICLMALIALFFIHLLIIKLNYADESGTRSKKQYFGDGGDGPTKTGLYSSEDEVFELTTFNFNANVYNSSSAWVVQFYNSWCGHCIKFSPIWKELAADIRGWKDVVVIAAIDCADDQNTQHCRDYEIMGYPTIRYFKPWLTNLTNGEEFARGGKDDIQSLRHTVITKLETTEKNGVPPNWPNLLLVPDNDTLWKDKGKQLLLLWNNPIKQLVLLVIENEASFTGSELILDLKDVPSVAVKRVLDSSYGQGVTATHVFAFSRPKENDLRPAEPVTVPIVADSRRTIFNSVRSYLLSLGIDVSNIFSAQNVPTKESKAHTEQSPEQFALVNTVFIDDLNMALRYSLFHEIPLQPTIEGDKLTALLTYVDVLKKYYPSDDITRVFLRTVGEELPAYVRLSGREFKKLVRNYGQQFQAVAPQEWVACKGSDSTLRGYPCSLWTLFHTLTVRELVALRQQQLEGRPTPPPEVLPAMAAYIRNFFGCSDCADHFAQMSQTIAGNVTNAEESVLWLWQAHNNVNARLAGDASEDPAFPKIQFPSSAVCPECRNKVDGSWRKPQVVDYLVRMYTNVQKATTPVAISIADGATVGGGPFGQRLQTSDGERAVGKGWNVGLTDMRTCIGLYVLCACLLTVYTLRFFVRRNPRNRPHKYEFTINA